MPLPDRLELLRGQSALTGIDFLYVHDTQTAIDVYFHVEPDTLDVPLEGDLALDQVHITSTHDSYAPALALSWEVANSRHVLRITVDEPGGFVLYRLLIDDPRLDEFFNNVPLNFKAGCPTRLDCAPRDPACVDDVQAGPPADFTARDFWSLRRAMLDAATHLEPAWGDRAEADAAIMLTEVLASIGDEFSYTQDRYRWEGSFQHATQRRSLRRHAQLVDHRIHNGLGASTWLAVTSTGIGTVAAGTQVWAEPEFGSKVVYSVGAGLTDELAGVTFVVDHRRNVLTPHIVDDGAACLPAGATELFVEGSVGAAFPDPGDEPLMVALHERSADASQQLRTWFVRITSGMNHDDPLVPDPAGGAPPALVTRLTWDGDDAPPFDLDLTETRVYGNIVPATAGETASAEYSTGPAPAPGIAEAVERTGPGDSVEYLYSLADPDDHGLVWRPHHGGIGRAGDLRATAPELAVLERRFPDPPVRWEWRPTLVGPSSSTPDDRHVTLDDGTWGTAVTYLRAGEAIRFSDWLSADGYTVRYGDGEFGAVPTFGQVFDVIYRLGNGRRGNVPSGAIRHHDTSVAIIESVTNLVAVTDGTEPETAVDVRRVAPYEWQVTSFRAVRTEDYAESLTRLPWVQAAGAVSRWTGSWLSVIATPDPRDAVEITEPWRISGGRQLDRFRQAGRDTWLGEPRYADIDVDIAVCVDSAHYVGDVLARVRAALVGDPQRPSAPYFFDPDNFVFGTPLYRTDLEAAVQNVPGVSAVEDLQFRRRGYHDWRPMPHVVTVASEELVRVANDRAHPERGSLRVETHGGA